MLGLTRTATVLALAGLLPSFGGCMGAGGGYETFEDRIEPPAAAARTDEPLLSATEIRYARDTARIVFRRRGAERSPDFVRQGGGYALCLRSGKDYALLVFARRIFEEAISQAADDNIILRAKAETAVCRESGRRWVAV